MKDIQISGNVNWSLANVFENDPADKLQTLISSGTSKTEMQEAAKGAIKNLEQAYQQNASNDQKIKYLDIGEKYARLFPDDTEVISHINEFAHDVLRVEQQIAPKHPSREIHLEARQDVKPEKILVSVLEGKISELSLGDYEALAREIDSGKLQVKEKSIIPKIAEAVFSYIETHKNEMHNDPTLATRAHRILHNLAQQEIASGNVKSAFEIESKASSAIPLSDSHPLHNMDTEILQGASRQYDTKTGAFFGSLDTSIVKGGHLHASRRKIEGEELNTFDFKISHYARDELSSYVDAIMKNPEEFKRSLPEGLAAKVTINQDVRQEFLYYVTDKKEFSRSHGYSPGRSAATEIVFEGVGKVIIGENKKNGSMYNRIQVEMKADLPPGEGAKKLQQMLGAVGLGPVIGQQPLEADERMKIAQLFRAFYPSSATSLDTTKEFYQLPLEELKQKIIEKEPGMRQVFKKYLEDHPELMKKVQIMPGKEVWGVADLGTQMKASGAWGLMTGIGQKGPEAAKIAIVRLLKEGALSSEQRFEKGDFKEGASSEHDLLSGGGDQVFTRLVNDKTGKHDISAYPWKGNAQVLWDLDSVAQRVPYGYELDKYGVKNRFKKPLDIENLDMDNFEDYDMETSFATYNDYEGRSSILELAETINNPSNEVMAKNSLDPSHIAGLVVESETQKNDLIKHLESEGLAELSNEDGLYYVKFAGKRVKADDFIHFGDKFDKSWWG